MDFVDEIPEEEDELVKAIKELTEEMGKLHNVKELTEEIRELKELLRQRLQ